MNRVSERFQTISLDRRLHKTTPKCNPWIVTISIQMFTCDKTRVCSHLEGLSDRSNSSLLFVDRTKHLYIEASIDHWCKACLTTLHINSLFLDVPIPYPQKKTLLSLPLPKRLLVHLHNSGYFFLQNIVLKERNKGLRKISTQQRVSVKNVKAKPS